MLHRRRSHFSIMVPMLLGALGCSDDGSNEGTTGPSMMGTMATTSAASSVTSSVGTTTITSASASATTGTPTSTASSSVGGATSSGVGGGTSSAGGMGMGGGATTMTVTSSTASNTGGATATATGAGGTTTTGGGSGGTGGGGTFTLTSSELMEGGMFMDKSTCAANGFDNDESPPLAWSGAPAGTQSFAIVFLDTTLTDQGMATGYHYAIWDIPASVSELPANLPSGATLTSPVMAKQYNPLSASYLGPCPNIGGGSAAHTYVFTIYAMPEAETASLAGLNDVKGILDAIEAAGPLGSASLSGTSDASPP